MKKQQSGFTLVEIAIVMVIIGLLLGGVLKGQEVITNARIKNINNDFSGVSAAIYSYQDRYATLPGDDGAAVAHVGTPLAVDGDGDGAIEGGFGVACSNPIVAGDPESCKAWSHLRAAGLISGDAATGPLPANAFGGVIGMSTGNGDGAGGNLNGIDGLLVAFTLIDGDMAVILDAQNDDGLPNTGTIRSSATIAAPATYVLTTPYSLLFEL